MRNPKRKAGGRGTHLGAAVGSLGLGLGQAGPRQAGRMVGHDLGRGRASRPQRRMFPPQNAGQLTQAMGWVGRLGTQPPHPPHN